MTPSVGGDTRGTGLGCLTLAPSLEPVRGLPPRVTDPGRVPLPTPVLVLPPRVVTDPRRDAPRPLTTLPFRSVELLFPTDGELDLLPVDVAEPTPVGRSLPPA